MPGVGEEGGVGWGVCGKLEAIVGKLHMKMELFCLVKLEK